MASSYHFQFCSHLQTINLTTGRLPFKNIFPAQFTFLNLVDSNRMLVSISCDETVISHPLNDCRSVSL